MLSDEDKAFIRSIVGSAVSSYYKLWLFIVLAGDIIAAVLIFLFIKEVI